MSDIYVTVIAEAGVNHNGSLKTAKQLVDAASKAGADYVKFQTFKANRIVAQSAPKAEYQKQATDAAESQQDMLKRLELTKKDHVELIAYCQSKRIKFLSSPFDLPSIDLLAELGLELFKIPSGEITNLPYLRKIGRLGTNVILSTGMSTLQEIGEALSVLIDVGTPKKNITVLHCNTEYPTPFSDVNLQAMATIKREFNVDVGYSDHTNGIEIPTAAVALGAKVIEKHFTLDRSSEGPDHQASLLPDELKAMVQAIRNVSLALGNGEKKPSPSEIKNIAIARKSIVAACPIKAGEAFNEHNLTTKRPGTGVSPMRWDEYIGKTAERSYREDEVIK